MKTEVFDEAIIINYITWYQVFDYPNAYGFAARDGIVIKTPKYQIMNKPVDKLIEFLEGRGIMVSKIADQVCS